MTEHKEKGILLDVDYFLDYSKKATIRVYLKTHSGIKVFFDKNFSPYFFVIVDSEKRAQELKQVVFSAENEKFKALNVEIEKKSNAKNVLKIFFENPSQLKTAREEIMNFSFVLEKGEFDIPFAKRYLIDKGFEPMNGLELTLGKENEILQAKKFEASERLFDELVFLAFDLETYSPERFSNPAKDPIISIAVAEKNRTDFFAWQKNNEQKAKNFFENETIVLEKFLETVIKSKPDIVVTYNGDNFDFAYLNERARRLSIEVKKAFGGHSVRIKRTGLENSAMLSGIQHVDAYKMVRLLNRFGVINLLKFDLESVCFSLFGTQKEKVSNKEINLAFETGNGMKRMLEYNVEDAKTALLIVLEYLPLYVEISKLVHGTLFDSTRNGASALVEDLLMRKAFEENFLVPNKPDETTVKQRTMQSFIGGYVKEPAAGLHENIAVLDFRSLHPSIMIAHNISPETLRCQHPECMNGKNLSPDKDWFCEKQKGFLPAILEEILKKRVLAKNAMKETDQKKKEYAFLKAKQQALKILLNSHYGYLGYPRSRWYSRESARAVTAWSRHYVKEINNKAEKQDYTVLYTDTDSCFLKLPLTKTKQDVLDFVKKINLELPHAMELEFDGFYKRGIFVTKRDGGAAKKRYALLDFNGNLKIVGFEYVRRDWAKIAKDTQREVIEAVLEAGKPEKAIQIVKQKIKKLKEGKVEKKDLIILTQIKKPLKKYESIGPHVAAAMKAVERGKEIEVGSTISFIITRFGKSISDKAQLEEFVKEGNYDADYYIEHQVVPAVIKIIAELGVSKEDLIYGGTQKSLGFFS